MKISTPLKHLLSVAVVALLLTGCKAYEKVIYLQHAGETDSLSGPIASAIPDPVIKPGDLLMITVNTHTPEAAIPFNLPLIPGGNYTRSYAASESGSLSTSGLGLQNYVVDVNGMITFPVVGNIKVGGLTKTQLAEKITESIYPKYLKEEPVIMIRFVNFSVSVLGEVKSPGAYPVNGEKISIFEAIAKAGDLTIYGNRANVLLLREQGESRQSIRVDLRDPQLIYSPYFYLQQNDVVYVEPNMTKARTSAIGTAETVTISVVGTLISLTTLVINILK